MKLLPLWLAPNMVTLLGFFFILSNVICLVIWMPDLVGPVCKIDLSQLLETLADHLYEIGPVMVVL